MNISRRNEHLKEISLAVAPGAHAVLVCDGAGWHQRGERLKVPDNITLLSLPPYCLELNPMENVSEITKDDFKSRKVILVGTKITKDDFGPECRKRKLRVSQKLLVSHRR